MAQPARTHEGKLDLFYCRSAYSTVINSNVGLLILSHVEIEQQIREIQKIAAQNASANGEGDEDEGRISLSKANMDSDIYGDGRRRSEYHSSIPANEADYDVSLQMHEFDWFHNLTFLTFPLGR